MSEKLCKLCKGKKTISALVCIKDTKTGKPTETRQEKTCPQCSGSGVKSLATK